MEKRSITKLLQELAVYVAAYEKSALCITKSDVDQKIEEIAEEIDELYG